MTRAHDSAQHPPGHHIGLEAPTPEQQRLHALGWRTISASTYAALIAAGFEPDTFDQVPLEALDLI